MNYTWNNKVSDQQNNVVLQRGGNNLLNKVETHHQQIKVCQGYRQKHRIAHTLQRVIPKAKHNQPKETHCQ